MRGMNDEGVARKAVSIKSDANQRREDDYAFIGGALGAVSSFCWCWGSAELQSRLLMQHGPLL